jgi:pSer/pThr/pTyr-binding forkhead associated (FHA) protein
MEPTSSAPSSGAPEPSPAGELVVLNGRLKGTRRTLTAPLTLIGRAPGCDVRLHSRSVQPHQCALVNGPAGLMLRVLNTGATTLVNGEPVGEGALREDDVLTVGPFRFRLRLPRVSAVHDVEALRREKETLRVQAAAVAAQQAGLTEQETRLQQRRVALERQEEQLAAHLEEKRQRLLDLQKQVQEARAALRAERAGHEQRTAEALELINRSRADADRLHKQARDDRQRLADLRRRLRRRFHRHWLAERTAVQRRESELAAGQRQLDKQAERLQQEREALVRARLQFNGAAELGRRQMEDDRGRLAAERRQLGCEEAELHRRAQELDCCGSGLAAARRELEEEKRRWQQARANLEKEVEGLNRRVRNQRLKMHEQGRELARLEASVRALGGRAPQFVPALPPEAPPGAHDGQRLAYLQQVSGDLADQRLHLLEQMERLVRTHEAWQHQREAAAAEMEAVARRLDGREQALGEREQTLGEREEALGPAEMALRQRSRELAQLRCHLEGWQARLAAREATLDAEQERLLAEVRAREERVQRQVQYLTEIRQRWAGRRRGEVERLRTEQAACQEAQRHFTTLWEEYFRRNVVVEQEQRALAERALAMEQYRLELIGRAGDRDTAERRLEHLRRRLASYHAAAQRQLVRERQALEGEVIRLEERARQAHDQALSVARREADLADGRMAWEQEQRQADEVRTRLHIELHTTCAHRDLYRRQLDRLNAEVERMANALIEEAETLEPPGLQAA